MTALLPFKSLVRSKLAYGDHEFGTSSSSRNTSSTRMFHCPSRFASTHRRLQPGAVAHYNKAATKDFHGRVPEGLEESQSPANILDDKCDF
jgi:hypothetical protein